MAGYFREFCSDSRPRVVAGMGLVYFLYAAITGWTLVSWAALAAGLLFFWVAEYVIHRVLLHGIGRKLMPKAYRSHVDHHEHPDRLDFMLTPNRYNVTVHPALLLLFGLTLQSVHLGAAFMGGFAAYQLYYEWAHFVSHRPVTPGTRWGRAVKKHHLLHHYKSAQAFYGVTNRTIDRLLGTGEGTAGGTQGTGRGKSMDG